MATLLPTQRVIAHSPYVQKQMPTYTSVEFVDYLLKQLSDKEKTLSGNRGYVYRLLRDRILSDKDKYIQSFKGSIFTAVGKAHDNGFMLLTDANGLTSDTIMTALGIASGESDATTWMAANAGVGDIALSSLNSKILDIANAIPDTVKDQTSDLDAKYQAVLADYGLDYSLIPSTDPLKTSINILKTQIESDYKEFIPVGTPATDKFFTKSGFSTFYNFDNKINAFLVDPNRLPYLAKEVERQMQTIFSSTLPKAGVDSRNLYELLSKAALAKRILTKDDIKTNFLPAFETDLNKFLSSTHNSIKGLIITPSKTATGIDVKIKFDIGVDTATKHIERILHLDKHVYVIEKMIDLIIDKPGHNNNHIPELVFHDNVHWVPGQVLTKADIQAAAFASPSLTKFISLLDKLEAEELISHGTHKIIFENGDNLIIQMEDPSILPTDFDYGDLTKFTDPDLNIKGHFFDRHITHTTSTMPDQIGNPIDGFTPQILFSPSVKISFESQFDLIIKKLIEATKPSRQAELDRVNIDDIMDPDTGLYKDIDMDKLKTIFDKATHAVSVQSVIDMFAKAPGITYTMKVTNVDDEGKGHADVTITVSDGNGKIQNVPVTIKTINSDLMLSQILDKLDEFENTWEDATPSSKPWQYDVDKVDFTDEGETPTVDELSQLYWGMRDLVTNSGITGFTITPNTKVNHDSPLTSEMIMSWNRELMDQIGSKSKEVKQQLDALLPLANLMKDSKSDYIMNNIEFDYAGTHVTKSLIAIHYLSEAQRFTEYTIIENTIGFLADAQLETAMKDFKLPEHLKNEIRGKFNIKKNEMLAEMKKLLKPDVKDFLVPDWELKNITARLADMQKYIDKLKDDYGISKDDLDKLKTASKIFRYILASIGGILGITSLVGLAVPIRTAIANKKYKKENPNSKRSSKGLIVVSTMAALLSMAASVGIMLYVFVAQGGL